MLTFQRILNALIIITICGILLSAFGVQIFEGERPCPLCLLQRLGMLGVAASLALNLRFGIRPFNYGLGLLSCIFGGFVALRQVSLHVCPQFPKFGIPVLGMSLYTWSFTVFVCSVFAIALLLMFYNRNDEEKSQPLSNLDKFAIGFLILITVANVITTFLQCGLGVCEDV